MSRTGRDRQRRPTLTTNTSMKYLLLIPANCLQAGYHVREFATAKELAIYIRDNGWKDAIIARRMGVEFHLSDWDGPAADEF